LRHAAVFVGQDPAEIIVQPNLKFVEQAMTPREAADLVSVWQSGAISKQTLYEDLQRGEIASAERTFDEEENLIAEEQIDQPMAPGMASPGGASFGGQPPQQQAPTGRNTRGLNGGTPPLSDRFVEDGSNLVFENMQPQ